MITHVMVDLETVGRPPDGGIIAIGAVAFDPARTPDEQEWNRIFEVQLDLEDVVRRGGNINPSTMKWWFQQDPYVREKMFSGTVGVVRGLRSFAQWYTNQSPSIVWANGTIFDISILDYTFAKNKVAVPWTFRSVRDDRIFNDIQDEEYQQEVEKLYFEVGNQLHDAVTDAIVQAKKICLANQLLEIY